MSPEFYNLAADSTHESMEIVVDQTAEHKLCISILGGVSIKGGRLASDVFHSHVDEETEVNVDLAKVTYIDTSAAGVFVGALKAYRMKRGDIIFWNAKPAILKVFELTGLEGLFAFKEGNPSEA